MITIPTPTLDMASLPPLPQVMEAPKQPSWMHFHQIYQHSYRLFKKLNKLSTPTEQSLASFQQVSTGLWAAIGAVRSDVPVFSSALASHLQSLEHSLPRYFTWLSDTLTESTAIPHTDPLVTKDNLMDLLTSVLVEFPARGDKEAWTVVLTDFEILHCWNRRREVEHELHHLRAQASRKPAEQSSSSPRLIELVRELDSLPQTLSFSCTPELRERLLEHEEHEAKWEKMQEERCRAEDGEKGHRDAMQVMGTLDRMCTHNDLAAVLQQAAAREKTVQTQSAGTSLADRGLTTRAWNILRHIAFLDCVAPVAGAMAFLMPPPSFHTTQHGVSLDFLMKALNTENRPAALQNRLAIKELVDTSFLTLHDEFKPTQRYTMAASMQFTLRWRQVVDSLEPVNRGKSFCDKALIETAAYIRKVCRRTEVTSWSKGRVLEVVRHARVLMDVPKIPWLRLEWYEPCGSWQFVAKLVEECEVKIGQS